MSDWPSVGTFDGTEGGIISTSTALLGLNSTAGASTPWPTAAGLAILVPVRLARLITIQKLVIGCGSTAGGNFDVGIYDRYGALKGASGGTPRVSAAEVVCDITNFDIGPGLYYLALSTDNTGNMTMITVPGTSPVNISRARLYGTLEVASGAYPLPATITPALRTGGLIPAIAAYLRPY